MADETNPLEQDPTAPLGDGGADAGADGGADGGADAGADGAAV